MAAISFGLGLVSLILVGAGRLALTDIARGEAAPRLEWRVLQVSFAVIVAFQRNALIVLGKLLPGMKGPRAK